MSWDMKIGVEARENRGNGLVFDGERVDDLQYKGLRIIQSPAAFCFGTDSVLLAHFARDGMKNAPKRSRVLDLGAGTGVLSLLLHGGTGLGVTAVELDPAQYSRLCRSLELNGLAPEAVAPVNADFLDPALDLGAKFDYAVCNPPYFGAKQGKLSLNAEATHELSSDTRGVALAARRQLKFGGKLFICYPCSRLAEALRVLAENGLEPKQLRLVETRAGAKPYLALIRANRGAKPGLVVENNLTIHAPDGQYTEEVQSYYDEQ